MVSNFNQQGSEFERSQDGGESTGMTYETNQLSSAPGLGSSIPRAHNTTENMKAMDEAYGARSTAVDSPEADVMPPFDEQAMFNPIRVRMEQLLKKKFKNAMNNKDKRSRNAGMGDGRHLVTAQDVREPFKRTEKEKKLMTDRAFYDEIMIKM